MLCPAWLSGMTYSKLLYAATAMINLCLLDTWLLFSKLMMLISSPGLPCCSRPKQL